MTDPTAPAINYPQEIEVQLTLKVLVNSQEERDYYLNPDTGQPAISLLADTFDSYMPSDSESLMEINNLTPSQVQAVLSELVDR